MTESNEHFDSQSELQVPKQLADDLSAIFGTEPSVPREVDQAIVAIAAGRLRRHRNRVLVLRFAVPLAAAAAIVLAVFVADPFGWISKKPSNVFAAVAAEDIDRNGTVNILDAFALARRVDAKQSDDQWDINRDGEVNRLDVDRIAMAAVSLDRGILQ